MDAQVVTNDMNRGDLSRDDAVEVIQEGDEFLLSFASETSPVYSACPGVKSCEEIGGTFADVFMFNAHGFLGFCGLGGLLSGTGLQGCLFIEREHHLMGK